MTGLGKQVLSTQNTLVRILAPVLYVLASYPKSVSFVEFLINFCTYDDILDTIWITGKSYCILNSQTQFKFVTGPAKTGHICIKYTCSENTTFLGLYL